MRRVSVLAASLCCWCTGQVLAQTDPARAADAMAFIRVVGDLRIDHGDASTPVVRRDVAVATGSGFVIAPSGLVLTNWHVVETQTLSREGGPEVSLENVRIQVFVGSGGSEGAWDAHVVASSSEDDLAALQLTAADLQYLPFGDSDGVQAGRPVKLMGFPFGRQAEVAKQADDVIPEVTVTAGSLSATRSDDAGDIRYLQTDATMLPGNSGGPMLDEDGYVVGVVRMKLSRDATSAGAGFTVPVNVVKEFLDRNGLLDRLPSVRLGPGVRHSLDWKQLAVDLPDGYLDRSPARVSAEAGEVGEIDFRVDRWETPWRASGLEEALLGGEAVRGFVPAAAAPGPGVARERRAAEGVGLGKPTLIGSGVGTDATGRRFRVEYAIVDLGGEKVVARYLGPADAVAFNLGLLRGSLQSLSVGSLLFSLPLRSIAASPDAQLEPATFTNGEGAVVVPRGWSREPATQAGCDALPPAAAGLLVRHPADFTLVLRALRWEAGGPPLARALASCGATRSGARQAGAAAAGPSYAFRMNRLGVPVAVRGGFVGREGETLLLELEAPIAKLPIVEEFYAGWVRQVTESP